MRDASAFGGSWLRANRCPHRVPARMYRSMGPAESDICSAWFRPECIANRDFGVQFVYQPQILRQLPWPTRNATHPWAPAAPPAATHLIEAATEDVIVVVLRRRQRLVLRFFCVESRHQKRTARPLPGGGRANLSDSRSRRGAMRPCLMHRSMPCQMPKASSIQACNVVPLARQRYSRNHGMNIQHTGAPPLNEGLTRWTRLLSAEQGMGSCPRGFHASGFAN